jgi:NADH-quinone oxidoreductase subunit L
MFHLATHAFFKALLFLAAGSVIHGLSHEQNIWKMGGLRNRLPVTYWTFLAGTLALCGLWPFSGFYSKDAVLAAAYANNKALFAVGVLVAFLTSFYMFRLVIVVFFGPAKSKESEHAHESPFIMTGPLIVLAVASVLGGFFGIEQFLSRQFAPGQEVEAVFAPFAPFQRAPVAALLGLAAFAAGLLTAFFLYSKAETDPIPARMAGLSRWPRNKFYFDEMYGKLIALTQESLADFANGFDGFIKLIVRVLHGGTEFTGRTLRLAQTGNLQTYALLFAAGIAVVLYFMLLH